MGSRRAYCDLEWGQLHYRSNRDHRDNRQDRQQQHGLPLVLLHQSPSDSAMYAALMQQLDQDFYMIAPDSPGFGASDSLPAGFSVAGCAAAVAQLLQQLGVTECLLFGHHTGASVAVQLAADNPELVQRLALSGPTLLSPQMQAALPAKAAPFPEQSDGSHLLAMWQRMQGKEQAAPADLLLREVAAAFNAGAAYQQAYQAVTEQDFGGQLAGLEIPVLVFAGTEDILYPQLAASYALLQQGQLIELEGAGGYVCDLQAEQVAVLLRDFFTQA